ncbi:glutamine-rich protein 2-like [Ara ararauna]
MASKLDRTELERFRQQLEEQWKRSLKQLQEKAPPREADNAAGIKKQLSSADSRCLSCDRQLSMRVPGSPVVPIPPAPPLIPRSAEKTPRTLNPGESKREQAAGCRYPSVPRQCRGQSTVLQPVPPSTPRSLKTSTAFRSKVGMKKEGIQRGQLWLGV